MNNLTFRSSKIIYYGPHKCENCGVMIARMGQEFGGNAFTYPDGPIYPNTEWHPHVCDPKLVSRLPKSPVPPALRKATAIAPSVMDAKTLCDWVKLHGGVPLSDMEGVTSETIPASTKEMATMVVAIGGALKETGFVPVNRPFPEDTSACPDLFDKAIQFNRDFGGFGC